MSATERFPTYYYQCVAGPDPLKVVVRDGVAVGVEPNCDMADTHPAGGKVCVRAYGPVQKLYNPARIRTPLRRTNPKKGRDENPGWVPISWDEVLGFLAGKLNDIRARGLTDGSGYPRLCVLLAGIALLIVSLQAGRVWVATPVGQVFREATASFRDGLAGRVIVGVGLALPAVALAVVLVAPAAVTAPAAVLAGVGMIAGQVGFKAELILRAALLRPITVANLRIPRRPS